MKIQDCMNEGTNILRCNNIDLPAREAGIILSYVINKPVYYLYSHDDKEISDDLYVEYKKNIIKRAEGMPIQYIEGKQQFMGLDFIVNKNVLIPRADTELLVEKVIELTKNIGKEDIRILEIGTGSGCISISIAYYCKNVYINALDISETALEVAILNSKNNKQEEKIKFIKSDIFSSISNEKFDIIVSNPPYINEYDMGKLDKSVKCFEPKIALYGGKDGVRFYKKIIVNAYKYLIKGGYLVLEIGYDQEYIVENILIENNFLDIKKYKDLSNITRTVVAKQ